MIFCYVSAKNKCTDHLAQQEVYPYAAVVYNTGNEFFFWKSFSLKITYMRDNSDKESSPYVYNM